ncbi:fungal specific transcription factor domain-containing protein [Colletotrichum truncatum]|uniref:Fungal specific transcription factor domain-containing protein n=1 Tax=Colletotrichum truncatum TaxID=5467 RepID=A0ACC3Z791_COLTU|nr:fungal specific transcription factor domain-containing protein [Colletotrichum truncatum]KAF6785289.1 fungal specific transcription factor domain-containing protein [Colletotrichum truncatum]
MFGYQTSASRTGSHPESPVSPHTIPPVGPPPPPRKARVSLACKRCKRRKQRCDGEHPGCKSCEKANVVCVYERPVRPQYPGGKSLYISALEERIAFLEAQMPDYAEDHFLKTGSSVVPEQQGFRRRESQESYSEDEPSSLVNGVAYLSLCASGTTDTAPEPFYLGSSSGATIARMLQSSIFHKDGSRATSDAMPFPQPRLLRPPSNPPSSSSLDDFTSELPCLSQAKILFNVFFDRLHTRWPILDRKLYAVLFEKQHNQEALSVHERSIMHLIYAISARFLQLMKKPCEVNPEGHLLAAIEHMDFVLEQHNLATVQFLILLAVHGQRSPFGAGCWSQVRYAMTLCIELGLHRKHASMISTQSPRENEIRKRVFWACYCLDRMTSVVLGRPFAIDDRDIDVELSSDSDIFWDLTALGNPPMPPMVAWSNMKPFIHIIKLCKIKSRIHKYAYRVDKEVFTGPAEVRVKIDSKMAIIRAELDEWAKTIPHPPKDATSITWMYDPESAYHDSRDFFHLQYHKSVLSLFTVLLPTLNTRDSRFLTCMQSAACICTAYKRLNQQKTLSYTMMALHSCFIAGLTLVYCLWRDKSVFSYDALEATRACSQSLTIFGEKWPGAVKYRDVFDALSDSLFKTIVNPSMASFTTLDPLGAGSETQPPATAAIALQSGAAEKPTISNTISDAVKEAFMEVDEEAPGGWQGWRMFNEMVQNDFTVKEIESTEFGEQTTNWHDSELLQDESQQSQGSTQMHIGVTTDPDWDFGALEGLQ